MRWRAMKKETKKAPTIRFRGFTNDWEQRKLSEYLVTSTDKNHVGRFSRADVLSVSGELGIINQIEFQGRSFAGASVLNYGIVKTNDIVYTKSPLKVNPYGIIKANAGKSGIVSTLYAIYHPKKNTDSKFIECYFDSNDRLNHYLRPLVNKGAKNDMKVMNKDVLKGKVNFPPTMKEQRIIASFITEIEMTTALYQRKLDQLKKLKKYFLQNMFPAKGEKVPRIRFKGFTGDWEQRKLGELADFNPKSSLPDAFEYVDLESVVGTEIINHKTESKQSAPSRAQRLAKAGDVFYQTVRPYQRNNCLFKGAETSYVFSTGYAQLRSYGDSYFLLTMLQNDGFVNEVLERCTGTSYPAINSNILAEINVNCPTNIQEQKYIGMYFSNLDNLITLHQRKLDQFQMMKKFMLQNMFI